MLNIKLKVSVIDGLIKPNLKCLQVNSKNNLLNGIKY